MKKLLAGIISVALLALIATGLAATAEGVWMYAVTVGKADAILLGVDGRAVLIDTGYAVSMGRIRAAMRQMGVEELEGVFITHTDSDHIGGLTWLTESSIPVKTWYASACYTGVKSVDKHPAVKAAAARGEEVVWLKAGDSVPLGGAVLEVLAPEVQNDSNENDNSLIMMLRSEEGRILLAGDMEFDEERILLASGADLDCDVLKVANHADDDTTTEAFVRASSPLVAVISTDSVEKPETPDPRILASLEMVGAETAVTQECSGGILVTLNDGVPAVERIDLPPVETSVSVLSAEAGADLVTLYNAGADCDLTDWYLVSDRGNELYCFPAGTVIASGETLVVGTNSSEEGTYDLRWDDKKVIHKSKSDKLTLYTRDGIAVSAADNGL